MPELPCCLQYMRRGSLKVSTYKYSLLHNCVHQSLTVAEHCKGQSLPYALKVSAYKYSLVNQPAP